MTRRRPLRILHLPVDLGGHPAALAAAQRALGHQAVAANLNWSGFGFNGDLNYARPFGDPARLLWREYGRASLFVRSVAWADVIHAHFGQTLASLRAFPEAPAPGSGLHASAVAALARGLWLKDVRLWRAMGKTVAMTFYGDDLRLVSSARARNPWSHLTLDAVAAPLSGRDPWKSRLVAALDELGVPIFAVNPDLMEVAAAARNAVFLPYGHVDVAATPVVPPRAGPVRFLHLPSVRDVKGTELFENAVGELKAAGVSCSLTVADSVSNDEAARLIAGHDVLLDQLRVGWYGGVAVEAMAAGKPVVAHIVDADLPRIPAQMAADLPVVRARPDTVADVLRSVAGWTEQERAAASERSRAFAERWHMPQAVARQVLDAYEAARQE